MEYMDCGSLYSLCKGKQQGKVPESILSGITKQVLEGLAFLHKNRFMHRDIKPQNILINSKGQVKLTDFGIAKALDSTVAIAATYVGTSIYMSPERMMGEPYSFSADIWSVGMTVFELATGVHPFSSIRNFPNLFDMLMNKPLPALPETYSAPLRDFVNKCLTKDTEKRSSAADLLKHPFITMKDSATPAQLSKYVKLNILDSRGGGVSKAATAEDESQKMQQRPQTSQVQQSPPQQTHQQARPPAMQPTQASVQQQKPNTHQAHSPPQHQQPPPPNVQRPSKQTQQGLPQRPQAHTDQKIPPQASQQGQQAQLQQTSQQRPLHRKQPPFPRGGQQ
eukprot:Filipodium_phascolosomae@DN1346_c0_g1_i1.p1